MKSTKDLIAEAVAEQECNAFLECKEASPHSRSYFIPCGAPAKRFILSEWGRKVYPMCAPCADHNVRNRGCEDVGEARR